MSQEAKDGILGWKVDYGKISFSTAIGGTTFEIYVLMHHAPSYLPIRAGVSVWCTGGSTERAEMTKREEQREKKPLTVQWKNHKEHQQLSVHPLFNSPF